MVRLQTLSEHPSEHVLHWIREVRPLALAMGEVVRTARPFSHQPGVKLSPEMEQAWIDLCEALAVLDGGA